MKKILICFEQGPSVYEPEYQELWDPEENVHLFSIRNLTECPEDAIIGRDVFDAWDIGLMLEQGILYSKGGYDSIEIIYEYCPDNENLDKFRKEYINNKEWLKDIY